MIASISMAIRVKADTHSSNPHIIIIIIIIFIIIVIIIIIVILIVIAKRRLESCSPDLRRLACNRVNSGSES